MTDRGSPWERGAVLTWLGQARFRLELGGLRVLIDPFVSEHPERVHAPPDAQEMATGVDWLLVTHGHGDHFDRDFVELLAARPLAPNDGET